MTGNPHQVRECATGAPPCAPSVRQQVRQRTYRRSRVENVRQEARRVFGRV
jgi:hypothetical protein